jgi:queuine tRNA-ribosyltransferase
LFPELHYCPEKDLHVPLKFTLQHTDKYTAARAGRIETGHGEVLTPIFMPVGTAGAVRAVHQHELHTPIQAQIILGNTYHLYLRPGIEVIQKAGGLHRFNGWNKPMLTDSGGYQIYSLSAYRKIKEEGATFQSHLDGSKHFFSPENVIDVQRAIGADIIMALDECTPYPCDYHYAQKSLGLTHRWLQRCCERFDTTSPNFDYEQTLFPIVQGSTFHDLRRQSAEFVASMNREGNAIGGLSVGEPEDDLYEMTELVCGILPKEKPRYLMGVGTPMNILEAISLGVDMFDCVLPTRNARHGLLYTAEGMINIKNNKWKDDFSPIDVNSTSFTSRNHSKAYLRHLIYAREYLGAQVASLHNLSFFLWLVGEARKHIISGDFQIWKNSMVSNMKRRL